LAHSLGHLLKRLDVAVLLKPVEVGGNWLLKMHADVTSHPVTNFEI